MNRNAFLARVRDAAERGRPFRVHVEPVPEHAGYVGAADDLCAALAAEVVFVGGESQIVNNLGAAGDAIEQLLGQVAARKVLAWQHPILDQLGLRDRLSRLGVAMHNNEQLASLPPAQQRATILAAEVGISSVDFAVAETGTLAVCARTGQERVISLTPPLHIAVVTRDQILPDLFDLFRKLHDHGLENLPSNLAMISGPSKTGDVELELTTGVHGPGRWHVIVVR